MIMKVSTTKKRRPARRGRFSSMERRLIRIEEAVIRLVNYHQVEIGAPTFEQTEKKERYSPYSPPISVDYPDNYKDHYKTKVNVPSIADPGTQ